MSTISLTYLVQFFFFYCMLSEMSSLDQAVFEACFYINYVLDAAMTPRKYWCFACLGSPNGCRASLGANLKPIFINQHKKLVNIEQFSFKYWLINERSVKTL